MSLRKIVIERVTVVKFRVDKRGSNSTGCFRIKVFKINDEKFSLGRVKSKKICRHPGGDVFQSSLKVGDTRVKVTRMEGEKKLSIICIKVVVYRK